MRPNIQVESQSMSEERQREEGEKDRERESTAELKQIKPTNFHLAFYSAFWICELVKKNHFVNQLWLLGANAVWTIEYLSCYES